MSRPEQLYPLFAGLETLPGIGPRTADALAQLDIEKPKDLLFHLPHSVIDRRRVASVQDVRPPTVATVEVTVGRHHKPASKGRPYRVEVEDEKTSFQLTIKFVNLLAKISTNHIVQYFTRHAMSDERVTVAVPPHPRREVHWASINW